MTTYTIERATPEAAVPIRDRRALTKRVSTRSRTRHRVTGLALVALLVGACSAAEADAEDEADAAAPAEDPGSQADAPDDHVDHELEAELQAVRDAVGVYADDPDAARAAGWIEVDGLDHCFERPGAGAMGYHLIDGERLEEPTVDPTHPEALVYVPDEDGELRLGAVEYIVPTPLWDEEEPPTVLGHDLHVLEPVPDVEVWGLHVWLFEDNADGMFADWNPDVSCPSDPTGPPQSAPGTPGTILPA